MNIIIKIIGASIGLYIVVYIIGLALPAWDCYGWECDSPVCPNSMAIEVPGKGFLKCSDFEQYIETEDERLLIK